MPHVHVSRRIVALYAMAALTILEGLALHHGVDGALLVPIATLIAGLGGFALGKTPPS